LEEQLCWEKTEVIPLLNLGEYLDEEAHEYIEYSIGEGECETYHNITPLFGKKIVICLTSVAKAESFCLGSSIGFSIGLLLVIRTKS
jgi:hypothetical protein